MPNPADRPGSEPGISRRRFVLRAAGGGLTLAASTYGLTTWYRSRGGPEHSVPQAVDRGSNLKEFNVKDFGAKGDGVHNDTRAFQRAGAAVTAAGSGRLVIPGGTYVVGRQRRVRKGSHLAYEPEPILTVTGCSGPVEIVGDGAALRAADSLRLGSFDPNTGARYDPPELPFTDYAYRADAYRGMIVVEGNVDVSIAGVELDGNMDGLVLGGLWGDVGRQCRATGVLASANERLLIRDVHSHHHGLDGLTLDDPHLAPEDPGKPQELRGVRSEYNARQGLSLLGGIGFSATSCAFDNTGQGRFASGPTAGVDIEPGQSVVRNAHFSRCTFDNNAGAGLIADSGDSADVQVTHSHFRGSSRSPALWPNMPGYLFEDCQVYGWVVNGYGSTDAASATQFRRCHFEDRAHPLIGRPHTGQGLIELDGDNISFEDCSIVANRTRSLYLSDPSTVEQMLGCSVIHRYDGLPSGQFQALIRGALVQETTFSGEFAEARPSPYYVAHDSVAVGPDVSVEGTGLTWGPNGLAGPVPEGP